ncbi:MAG TPA: class I SAM-dependent methyltransferase [Micrococcaceae bacterium]
MDTQDPAIDHYSRGDIRERIFAALEKAGKNPEHLLPEDLAGADEFHIGGIEAARDLARGAGISGSSYVLDVGSGIGGPARLFAHEFGATVHGVDLTPEFVEVAGVLTARTGLSAEVTFSEGNALDLKFEPATFDVATMLHVGMHIQDKPALFSGLARLLKPGGILAVYDIMRMNGAGLTYPLPWAAVDENSFVATPMDYSTAMEDAGFVVDSERNRHDAGIAFLEEARARAAAGDAPAVGLALVLGPEIGPRMRNLLVAFRAGALAPVEIYARKTN